MRQHLLGVKDRRGARWWTSAALALVCVLALDGDLVEALEGAARKVLDSSAKAHLAVYEATRVTAPGERPEFLVLLDDAADRVRLEAFLSTRPDAVIERSAGTERWLVVSAEPGATDLAEALRGQSWVRIAAPNRGLLFCH